MNNHKPCRVCPAMINEMKKTAILIGTLARIGTPDAVLALQSAGVLTEEPEPALCETAEDWQI